jgi:hypothetical protein
MSALSDPRPEPLERSAEIIPFSALNRARTQRVLDRDPGPPGEAHPWAYVFPRPSQTLSSRT